MVVRRKYSANGILLPHSPSIFYKHESLGGLDEISIFGMRGPDSALAGVLRLCEKGCCEGANSAGSRTCGGRGCAQIDAPARHFAAVASGYEYAAPDAGRRYARAHPRFAES